jgi:hypothetical protein
MSRPGSTGPGVCHQASFAGYSKTPVGLVSRLADEGEVWDEGATARSAGDGC